MKDNNKPAHTLRIGNNQAAIWKNTSTNGDFYNVTFSRTYNSGEQIKNSSSFVGRDLLAVAKLADQAHTWILDNK